MSDEVHLSEQQEALVKLWAADDRLWHSVETAEFNLRVFARAILQSARAAQRDLSAPAASDPVEDALQIVGAKTYQMPQREARTQALRYYLCPKCDREFVQPPEGYEGLCRECKASAS